MEISGKKTPGQLEAYTRQVETYQPPNRHHTLPGPAKTDVDTVSLSPEAKQIQATVQRFKEFPEVREERVAAIRRQLDQGTYRIDARQIALNMLKESLADEDR